ncbi:MAG TPA: hypothetical protein PKA38_02200 [Candidatus Levybacteria bacterium]|nr:hypothetical protein [Candidatus Levybacteria bacterium]
MIISPYKQTLSHSCLATCFLMLRQKHFNEFDEQKLTLDGSKRIYPFYVVGIAMEFVKQFNSKLSVYVDNKYFASVLKDAFKEQKSIEVIHQKNTLSFISEQLNKQPLICHIDDHALGDYSHASHFIILEKATNKYIEIVDPWFGKRKMISNKTLENAIHELRVHVKMCPLIFSIGEQQKS